MYKDISIDEAMNIDSAQFVDVRSPSEFCEACIPGAINIPLLSDKEREIVGTVYKQQSPEKARMEALKMISNKLPDFVEQFIEVGKSNSIVLYCWRGGMRSSAAATFLDIMGVPAKRLLGGFKAYRRQVNNYFAENLNHTVYVVHGLTGVGKTEVIYRLMEKDVPAIDLEGLANNRGSVFGNVGMNPQPSQKMFEGLLANQLRELENGGFVVVEGESRRIGRLILPEKLFQRMNEGIRILLYCSVEKRIQRIKEIYTNGPGHNIDQLINSVESLSQRLGKQQVRELVDMIRQQNFDDAIRILLVDYYDPLYNYPNEPDNDYDICISSDDPDKAAEILADFVLKRQLSRR